MAIMKLVGLCILIICLCSVIQCVKILNDKSCETHENPLTFEVYEMECKFEGSDVYIYKGSTARLLSLDRLTKDSTLIAPASTTLNKVRVENGDATLCDYVKAPTHVAIYIGNLLCVSIHKSPYPHQMH